MHFIPLYRDTDVVTFFTCLGWEKLWHSGVVQWLCQVGLLAQTTKICKWCAETTWGWCFMKFIQRNIICQFKCVPVFLNLLLG